MQPETKKTNFLIIGLVILLIIIAVGFLATRTADSPSSITQVENSETLSPIEENNSDNKTVAENQIDSSTTQTPNENKEVANEKDVVPEKEPLNEPVTSNGTYTNYSASAVANSNADNIILFFHATWCPSCHALNSDINANLSDIPAGTEIYKVDYDTSPELRKKYSVTTQHTLVKIDKNGNLLKKWDNSMTLNSLVSKI